MTLGGPSIVASIGVALAATCIVVACDEGQDQKSPVTEAMYASGAQFIPGDMPGSPPLEDGGVTTGPLSIVSVSFNNIHVIPGASGKSFGGAASTDSYAVGMRIADLGTGYWVTPVSSRDGQIPNAVDFGFNASFDIDDPPGLHNLRMVALDGNGNGGTQVDTQICIESRVPDNNHACDPNAAVPAVVMTLEWDANFDLDLHVVAPDGTDINPKSNPLQVPVDAGQPPSDDPKIDRDSLGQCIPDGRRQEDLVFLDYPAVGPYDLYADPFSACGLPAVRFTVTIWEAGDDGALHATYTKGGELLANDVTGGGSSGLFLIEKVFN
jgi:hypothetical protein